MATTRERLQEINNSLEETAHQVIRSLPFVLKQAESLEEEALLLKSCIAQIQAELHVAQDSDSVERIKSLHTVMQKMQSYLDAANPQERESSPLPIMLGSHSESGEPDNQKDLV